MEHTVFNTLCVRAFRSLLIAGGTSIGIPVFSDAVQYSMPESQTPRPAASYSLTERYRAAHAARLISGFTSQQRLFFLYLRCWSLANRCQIMAEGIKCKVQQG